MENPQPDMSAIEMTDEEIWRAIRDLDPDQRRNASEVAFCHSSRLHCVVLADFRGLQVIGKIAGGSPTMIRRCPDRRLQRASPPDTTDQLRTT